VSKFGEDPDPVYRLGGPESEQADRRTELQNAVRGILGMLHFADYQSPILLEALGDLLITGDLDANGTRLAARAYVRAAQLSKDPLTADQFKTMARQALANQLPYSPHYAAESVDLPRLEKELAAELARGADWFGQIEANERKWIADGADVDREFATAYYDSLDETITAAAKDVENQPVEPRPLLTPPPVPTIVVVMAWLVPALLSVAVIAGVVKWIRQRKRLGSGPAIPASKPDQARISEL